MRKNKKIPFLFPPEEAVRGRGPIETSYVKEAITPPRVT